MSDDRRSNVARLPRQPAWQPLTVAELEADSIGSFNAAVRAIGERVRAGEPLPTTGYFGTRGPQP